MITKEQKTMRWIITGVIVLVILMAVAQAGDFAFVDVLREGEWYGRSGSKFTETFTDLSEWTNGTSNPVTITSGEADIDTDSDTVAWIERSTFKAGRIYNIVFDVSTVTAGSLGVYVGSDPTITDSWTCLANADTTIIAAGEDINYTFYADGTYLAFFGSIDADIEFDDLEVYELNGRLGFVRSLADSSTVTFFMAVDADGNGSPDGLHTVADWFMPYDDTSLNYFFPQGDCKAIHVETVSGAADDSVAVYREWRN